MTAMEPGGAGAGAPALHRDGHRCAARGEWRDWADLFTDDAQYLEHTFGTFHGRDEIYEWIAPLMAEWPNRAMTSFPHSWCVCDEERGGGSAASRTG